MSDLSRERDQAEDAGAFDAYRDERWDAGHGWGGHGPSTPPVHDHLTEALNRATARYGYVGTPGSEPCS